MSVCTRVKRWIAEEIQVPAERFVETASRSCTEYKRRVERRVTRPVERWISRQERKCKKRPWYDPRRWLCTIINTLVKVVMWVVTVVIEWVPYLICKTVMVIIRIVVMVVVRVLKFVGVFLVCIFTDPLGALGAIWDLWTDLLDVIKTLVDFLKSLLDDISEFATDIERLLESVACGFGPAGAFFLAGPARFVGLKARDLADLAHDLLCDLARILLSGLRLNWCGVLDGLAGLGADVAHVLVWVLSLPFGLGGGARDAIKQGDLERVIEERLEQFFPDEDQRERIRDRLGLGGCPFGVPFELDPLRFYVSSRSKSIDLRELHNSGEFNLFSTAGQPGTDCGEFNNHRRWEIVYAETSVPVSRSDLATYIGEGRDAAPEFRVYGIPLAVFDKYLRIAQRKAWSIGLDFQWDRIKEAEWQPLQSQTGPPDPGPLENFDSGFAQRVLFPSFGRLQASGDDICVVPAFNVLFYQDHPKRSGFTSQFPSPVTNISESGVTFVDKIPEYFFRWVLIHELGHYFGLEHDGHDGLHHIMWTPAEDQGLDKVTGETVAELFLTGEPQFTRDDAENAWNWILTNARSCLDDEVIEDSGPIIE